MDNKLKKLMEDLIIVDTHNDTMLHVVDKETWLPVVDIGRDTDNHIDIPKLKKGGINLAYFAAFNDGFYGNIKKSLSASLALINALYFTERNNTKSFKIIRNLNDIEEALREKKIAALPTLEGGYAFDRDNSKELLKQFLDLGVRVIGFNWNYSNKLGEGASGTYNDKDDRKSPKGLTKLGKEVIGEMNKLGMLVDVSHMSEETFWDTIEVSKSPIIASHSGVNSLREHPRNLNDKQLKALAENGGVIGMVLCQAFLTDKKTARIKDFVDHIDYAVDLIGVNHVGIGSDFDGTTLPLDIKDSSEMYKIVDEMLARGYRKDDIKKILGENMLRVLKDVEVKSDNKNKINDSGKIILDFQMGEKLKNPKIIRANLEKIRDIDIENSKIILDGISYKGEYHKESSSFSLKLDKALEEKFHLLTFEIAHGKNKRERLTRIFIIKLSLEA